MQYNSYSALFHKKTQNTVLGMQVFIYLFILWSWQESLVKLCSFHLSQDPAAKISTKSTCQLIRDGTAEN